MAADDRLNFPRDMASVPPFRNSSVHLVLMSGHLSLIWSGSGKWLFYALRPSGTSSNRATGCSGANGDRGCKFADEPNEG